ncbi:MAG: hypothetical protein WCE58_12825, partial [Gallionella sp.]
LEAAKKKAAEEAAASIKPLPTGESTGTHRPMTPAVGVVTGTHKPMAPAVGVTTGAHKPMTPAGNAPRQEIKLS